MASHYNSIFALMKAECLQKVVRQPKENIYLRNKEIQLHTYGHFIQCLCKDTDESSLVCVVLAWLIKMLHQIITKRHTENQQRSTGWFTSGLILKLFCCCPVGNRVHTHSAHSVWNMAMMSIG